MLTVISPAKKLDFDSPLPTSKHSQPAMLEPAGRLVEVMRTKSPDDLRELMSISPALAELNFERFMDWHVPFTPANARPALLAFSGDTYVGLDAAATFDARDYTHAQKTLRILSGLYGVLRPLDLMQPYRLEMGSNLAHPGGTNLYEFWGDTITDALAADLDASPGTKALVNLASAEYFAAVRPDRLGARVVTPRFLDADGADEYRVVGFFAKRARGAMASWIIRERVKSVRGLQGFGGLGYRYSPERSTPTSPVFLRRAVR